MPMTIVVTRNLPARFSGFLSSCMVEIAPAVFIAPRLNKNVRERVWEVAMSWSGSIPGDGGFLMIWHEPRSSSGFDMNMIGWPRKELTQIEGIWLSFKPEGEPEIPF